MEINKKKVYQKPEIQEVKLVPEEAVLTACKDTARTQGGCNAIGRCNRAGGTTTIGS